MTKQTHYITVVSHGESTIIDIDLSREEYELLNRISALTFDAADVQGPVLVISKPLPSLEEETAEVKLNTNAIPIVKPRE